MSEQEACRQRDPSRTYEHDPRCDDDGWNHFGPCVIDETADLVERATKLGAEHGQAGGSWVFDGNTTPYAYRTCVRLDETGSPEWWDHFGPSDSGPLSGEWADGMSVHRLVHYALSELGDEGTEIDPDVESEMCDAYEQAYYDAWRDEVLRMARYQVDGES